MKLLFTHLSLLVCILGIDGYQAQATEESRTRYFQKNNFIVSEQLYLENEIQKEGNYSSLQEFASTAFAGDEIYSNGRLLDTNNNYHIYVLDQNGNLFVTSRGSAEIHHSYILKSKPEKPFYGIGRNVACAGMLKAHNGKITYIDNESGHYLPIPDQLKLAVQYLHRMNAFAPKPKIVIFQPHYDGGGQKEVALDSILSENLQNKLQTYPSSFKRTQEYIEGQREREKKFNKALNDLTTQCPLSFVKDPITRLLPKFKPLDHRGRVEYGILEIEHKKWKALIINSKTDLLKTEELRWGSKGTVMPLSTPPHKGVVTRYATCHYDIIGGPEWSHLSYYSLFLIPQ